MTYFGWRKGLTRILLLDLLFAARQLRRHRAYAMITVLSMTLGVGAAAAVYVACRVNRYPVTESYRHRILPVHETSEPACSPRDSVSEGDRL